MGLFGMQVGLETVMLFALTLFAIGLYGALSKKSAIQILMSLEIMAMAMSINIVAINRWVTPVDMTGWFFALFEMALSAAEVGIGLALIVALYRRAKSSEVDDFDELKG